MVTRDNETAAAEDDDRTNRAGVLPWIVLVLVALVVVWLLRGYAFGPDVEPGAVRTETTTVNVAGVVTPGTESTTFAEPSAEATEVSRVPDVVGLFESDARKTVEREGFEISVTTIYSTSEPVGMVFDQVPSASQEAEQGSVVAVLVSAGPAPTGSATVPDLVGLKIEAAKDRIEARGLDPRLMIQPIHESPGRVFQQSPKAGAKVSRGSKVFILAGEAPGY